MLLCFTLILSACTQREEDTQEYSGIIVDGKVMGYEYTVTKEENSFSWKVGYKGDITTIEESIDNQDELQNFMMAVSDSKLILSKLIISLSYFIIVAVISFFLYKKNRKTLKDVAIVVVLASIIALYIAIDASFDLSIALQDIKLHYLRLTN
ncbi:hypothetical protein PMSM_21220 [Paenibacillus macquariensis subsp. macquariensis]|nr:hypothetical protein PMSM_21220 [Paenibacillus macquariensis subsp. macquariensis]